MTHTGRNELAKRLHGKDRYKTQEQINEINFKAAKLTRFTRCLSEMTLESMDHN